MGTMNVKCPVCKGDGCLYNGERQEERVTRDMALDACDPTLEGSVYREAEPEFVACQLCDGSGEIEVETPAEIDALVKAAEGVMKADKLWDAGNLFFAAIPELRAALAALKK